MPIRINLLAEEQALEEMRRKDPVKRAVWIGGFAVFLVLLWGLTLFFKLTILKSERSGLDADWNALEKNVKQVEDNRRFQIDVERQLSALVQFTTNRFLWGTALNAFQKTCLTNIQLVRIKSEQTYNQVEPPKPPPRAAGLPPSVGATAAKSALAVEKIVIMLDGREYAATLGEKVSRFRENLQAFPLFEATLQRTNGIQLTSLVAGQVDQSKKTNSPPFAQFGLQLNLQEKERRLYD